MIDIDCMKQQNFPIYYSSEEESKMQGNSYARILVEMPLLMQMLIWL